MGGYASLCVAAENPQAAAGLILLNSAGPFSDSESKVEKKGFKSLMGKVTRSILLQPLPSYLLFQYVRRRSVIRKTLKQVYLDHNAVSDRLVEEIYRPSCARGARQVFAAVFKSPQGEKIDILLNQMECPLLMLWGEGDPWMNTREKGAKFCQHYPQLTEHYLQAGHCPHDEIPEEVNELIKSWVLAETVEQ